MDLLISSPRVTIFPPSFSDMASAMPGSPLILTNALCGSTYPRRMLVISPRYAIWPSSADTITFLRSSKFSKLPVGSSMIRSFPIIMSPPGNIILVSERISISICWDNPNLAMVALSYSIKTLSSCAPAISTLAASGNLINPSLISSATTLSSAYEKPSPVNPMMIPKISPSSSLISGTTPSGSWTCIPSIFLLKLSKIGLSSVTFSFNATITIDTPVLDSLSM